MRKENNILILGIVLIVALLLLHNYQKPETKETGVTLNLHYFKEGIEVFPGENNLFTIVTGGKFEGGDYDSISIDIVASNSGQLPISNIKIDSSSPQQFTDSLPSTTQTLAVGETNKILWSSEQIDASQFEGTIQTFEVGISGNYESYATFSSASVDIGFGEQPTTPGWCYQEFADVSTACGGLASGSYISTGECYSNNPCSNAYDGNWNTMSQPTTTGADLYINYVVPNGAKDSSIFMVKIEGKVVEEYPLSELGGCWNTDTLHFRTHGINSAPYIVEVSCYDGSSWVGITSNINYIGTYEEAMNWNIA